MAVPLMNKSLKAFEPTIGFSDPSSSSLNKSSPSSNLKSSSTIASSVGYSITTSSSSNNGKLTGTVSSSSEMMSSNVQKCSLLRNCLTQPLSSHSSSNAAVSAALANNILTSTPVPNLP